GPKPFREEGHEGRIERAFREKCPEQVGEFKRNEKSVGDPARAHHGGEQHVAQKSKDPARRRQPANREKTAIKAHRSPKLFPAEAMGNLCGGGKGGVA